MDRRSFFKRVGAALAAIPLLGLKVAKANPAETEAILPRCERPRIEFLSTGASPTGPWEVTCWGIYVDDDDRMAMKTKVVNFKEQ